MCLVRNRLERGEGGHVTDYCYCTLHVTCYVFRLKSKYKEAETPTPQLQKRSSEKQPGWKGKMGAKGDPQNNARQARLYN